MVTESANAKLNLFLRVTGRRADGYHDLAMLNVSLDLADRVSIDTERGNARSEPRVEISLSGTLSTDELARIPTDGGNLVAKAVQLASIDEPISIARCHIEKNIPSGAGLAGGSSDAAAALRILKIPIEKAAHYALRLGADVPYCLHRGPAIVKGIGERITPIEVGQRLNFVLVNPGIFISTKEIFKFLNSEPRAQTDLIPETVAEILRRRDILELRGKLHNDLEALAFSKHPSLYRHKAALLSAGAIEAAMTGSGSTLFGIFSDIDSARQAEKMLTGTAPFVRFCTSN